MAFRAIVGQTRALQTLQHALSTSRLAPAYLFYGPSGVGKKLTAWQFVKALYCRVARGDACDACTACHKIATGNHPDVTLIAPENTTIKIDQIRLIQRRLSYKPYEQQRTTIIIDGCEHLTPPAANALLKTLEEPPAKTLLLLLCGNKHALPLTIISRCQLVPFQSLTPPQLWTILTRQGIDTDTATRMASLAEGRLDRLQPENFAQALSRRQHAYHVLREIMQARTAAPFLQARQLAGKRDQCEELLRWLSLLIRDLTMLKIAPPLVLYNHDLRSELTSLASHIPLARLVEAFDLLLQLQTYHSLYGNPQLLFEQWCIQLHQAFTLPASPPPSPHRADW